MNSAAKTGKSRRTIGRYIKTLQNDLNLISRVGSDKGGRWVVNDEQAGESEKMGGKGAPEDEK